MSSLATLSTAAEPSAIGPNGPSLAWTGERMIPNQSDPVTEMFHWQRYLYFRPWYMDARVFDAASGEGYGLAYAATFAQTALGIDLAEDAVRHAQHRYPFAKFRTGDVCAQDYSQADLVLSFETIEHLPDPGAFLSSLKTCPGRIVISTPNRNNHSPGNTVTDKPWNEFHTIEWTPAEFAALIEEHFPDRQVRFLSQENRWPGIIREGLDDDAKYVIAVIGDGDLPVWPRIGVAMPTVNESKRVEEAISSLTRQYPGDLEIAVVANGSNEEALAQLRNLQTILPHIVHLIEEPTNLGYGLGANKGLDFLWQEGWFDFFGVINDDVIPSIDCVPQMVSAWQELVKLEKNPGLIGPMTNCITGPQQIEGCSYTTLAEMFDFGAAWSRQNHSGATETPQIKGLFFLTSPECLSDVGGFDPVFGIGNFEDDDYNVRVKRAGYTMWLADGAFLHHAGSSTFKALEIDYDGNILRNLGLLLEKWDIENYAEAWKIPVDITDDRIHIPLTATLAKSEFVIDINGESIDLVYQAGEFDLAAWIVTCLRDKPRENRIAVLKALKSAA